MSVDDIPVLERPAFFDGQLLDAADFAAVALHQRALRWLHNRTLHGWGVVRGLAVSGKRGDRVVGISPGYALDCSGRELLLPEAATLPVPPVAGGVGGSSTFYLTISYLEDDALPVAESRPGSCGSGGAVRRPERARLRWQSPLDVDSVTRFRSGLDVLLAAVEVAGCRLDAAPETALRREVAGTPQPYVAGGTSPESATPWQVYPASGPVLGAQAVVDTSSAGFVRTPVYTAHVVGARQLAASGPSALQLIDGAAAVEAAGPASFLLRVSLPRDVSLPPYRLNPASLLNAKLPDLLRQLEWHVAWIGVEA